MSNAERDAALCKTCDVPDEPGEGWLWDETHCGDPGCCSPWKPCPDCNPNAEYRDNG